jgi:hypothetical protein
VRLPKAIEPPQRRREVVIRFDMIGLQSARLLNGWHPFIGGQVRIEWLSYDVLRRRGAVEWGVAYSRFTRDRVFARMIPR